jgi:hypothetical protein
VLAFLLRLRGVLCLHAAVVVIGGRAVAIAGPPGAGKSTIAMALAHRGHAILTDDVAAVVWQGGRPGVEPGPTILQPRKPERQSTETDLIDMASLSVDQPQHHVRLEGICALSVRGPEGSTGGAVARSLTPAQAAVALLSDSWASRLQSRPMRADEFGSICRLTSAVRLARIERDAFSPAGIGAIAELVERFAEHPRTSVVS